MGKYKPMNNHQYADMYGIQMKDEYDDEGNRNDNDNVNKDMIYGHQVNNYDMRRAHEMLQDDGFRRHMKQEGFKGVDRMVKDNLPSSAMLTARQGVARGAPSLPAFANGFQFHLSMSMQSQAGLNLWGVRKTRYEFT